MKFRNAFIIGLMAAMGAFTLAQAQTYVQNPYVTLLGPIQAGDYIYGSRAGVSANFTWPAVTGSFPVATSNTNGIAHPGSGMTVDGTGALNVTTTQGSFQTLIGTVTTANPWVSGNIASGFYSPGANIAGVELNHIPAMQWNTLSSGVDYINITPGKSGTPPLIQPGGSTANQSLHLTGTGTGTINANSLIIDTSGEVTTGVWKGTAVQTGFGGTGLTGTPTNGQVAIGTGSGYALATLTGGTGVTVSNGSGSITISSTTSGGGSVGSGGPGQAAYYTTSGTSVAGNAALWLSTTAAGIGTTTPAQALEVNGNEQLDGGLYLTTTNLPSSGKNGFLLTAANKLAMLTTGSAGITQWPDQGVTIGAATGNSEGAGTLNVASGFYVNGTVFSNGALTLITTGSFSGTTLALNSTVFTGYKNYLVMMDHIQFPTGMSNFETQLSSNNGSGFLTTAYVNDGCAIKSSIPGCQIPSNITTFFDWLGSQSGISGNSINGGSASFWFYNLADANPHAINWDIQLSDSGGNMWGETGHALQGTTTTVNYAKWFADTGTWATNYRVYGIQ